MSNPIAWTDISLGAWGIATAKRAQDNDAMNLLKRMFN
jgi:hypothetical protein